MGMIMKLTKSLIIATLASGTLWAQAPTNQVISNAKSQVNSVGTSAPSQGPHSAKPSATSTKAAVVKSGVPAKPVTVAPKPVSTPATHPVNGAGSAPTPKPATPATKAAQPSVANAKPATQSTGTKPVPTSAKPAVPAAKPNAPGVVTKTAPVAIKATTNAAPERKPLTPETKKPASTAAKKPVAETKKPVAKVEAKPATKTNEKAADATKPASAKETTTSRVSSMVGKRDPFVSPIVRASAGGPVCETGKRCLMVDQIELKGIVKSPSGFIAVVENPMKRAYFLRENDPVFNGSVVKITADTVVFRESTTDKLGKQGMREVVKKVNAPVV
jgi:Tfp pilus assembly protein PilP